MNKALVVAGIVAAVSTGAVCLYAAPQAPNIELDLGPAPITAQQVRDKLTAAGFQNVQVTPRLTFDTLAFKDGRSMKLAGSAA